MRVLNRFKIGLICFLSMFLVAVGGPAQGRSGSEPEYFFRAGSYLIDNGGGRGHNPLSISLSIATPFRLTTGEHVNVPLIVSGDASDVTYSFASVADAPGLHVDPTTGEITGTPNGVDGDVYRLAVMAVVDSAPIAFTQLEEFTLRDPLSIDSYPSTTSIPLGDNPNTHLMVVTTQGGRVDGRTWELENAPAWLDIIPAGSRGYASLEAIEGEPVPAMPLTEVTIKVTDGDGRTASATFDLEVVSQPDKLIPDPSVANDYFGYSIAMASDASRVLVGSRRNADGGAYVFADSSGESWVEERKLTFAGIGYLGEFVSMSDDGSVAVVGSQGSGAVLFKRDGLYWEPGVRLTSSGGAAAVSGDGTVVIVGDKSTNKTNVYRVDGPSPVQMGSELSQVGSVSSRSGYFGSSVALSDDGETAIVGAFESSAYAWKAGAAFVYKFDGVDWVQDVTLDSQLTAQTNFGFSVDLSSDGNTAVVGAKHENASAIYRGGAAYVFSSSGPGSWSRTSRLTSPTPQTYGYLGTSVAISDSGKVIVGEPGENKAYIFSTSGTLSSTLTAFDDPSQNGFGCGVAITDNASAAAVGACNAATPAGSNSGVGYVIFNP